MDKAQKQAVMCMDYFTVTIITITKMQVKLLS